MNRLIYIMILAVFSSVSYAHSEKKLALVIGNSEYGKSNYLQNPVHDAEDVASKLEILGFDVIKMTDGTLREMHEFVSDFGEKAKSYDVALFYYSGHGLQTKGENYLMPIDAELKSEADVRYMCLPLNLLLDKLDESNCPMKIIVLDACRNNPFVKRWYRGDSSNGLASVNPPKGTYITFSTAAGSVALDGIGRNSPYTTAFLETLDIPNLSLFDFFNEVGKKVLVETNNEQDPWTNHNTMKGLFFFNTRELSPSEVYKQKYDKTFPKWFASRKDDEWIGVSVPMKDKRAAKKNACLNALLKYILVSGGANLASLCSKESESIQVNFLKEYQDSDYKMEIETMLLFPNFRIEIKDEFYNINDECFIRCKIVRDSVSKDAVLAKQHYQISSERRTLSYSVKLALDGDTTNLTYNFISTKFGENINNIRVDGIPIECSSISYPDVIVDEKTTPSFIAIDIQQYGSLGGMEFAILAQSPLIPMIADFTQNSKTNSRRDSVKIISLSQNLNDIKFLCDSQTQSFPISFTSIIGNKLSFNVTDPEFIIKDNVKRNKTKLDFESFLKQNDGKLITEIADVNIHPLMIGKTIAMYESIIQLAHHIEINITGLDSDSESLTYKATRGKLSDFQIHFFMDGNSPDKNSKIVVAVCDKGNYESAKIDKELNW